MGSCSRSWFALMRRNWIYRRRYWISTILELASPVLFVYILVAIKNAAENSETFQPVTIDASFPDTGITPLTFTDYVTALRAKRMCISGETSGVIGFEISGISRQGYNWQVPLVKCNSRLCTNLTQDAAPFCEYSIVAVTGTDDGGQRRAAEFKTWVETTYPAIVTEGEMPFRFELVQLFSSPQTMDDYIKSIEYGGISFPKIAMGIVWQGDDALDYKYELRPNSTNFNAPEEFGRPVTQTTPSTLRLVDSFARNDFSVCVPVDGTPNQGPFQFSCTGQYLYNGVLTFQRLVHDFVIRQSGAADAGTVVAEAGVQFVPFPTKAYVTSGFFESIEAFAPLIVILGLLYPVASMISYVVKEKELRQKELMKMMGVSESDIGLSWFLTFLVLHVITATLAAILSARLYSNSSFEVLWLFWMLTVTSIVVFCMTVASLTAKTIRAVLIGLLVFFAGVFLTYTFDYREDSAALIQLISVHPVAAFSYGLNQIGHLEDKGIGLTIDTIRYDENPSGYSFSHTINMLLIDCFVWSFLAWYLNRVVKPDYGQALPCYFPFTSAYWCANHSQGPLSETSVCDKMARTNIPYEPVSDGLMRQTAEGKSIEIHDLRKVFGEKCAVDSLNLSMYSGQITALLGHNGAGKTTTINMLTGAMGPTEGYATIVGKDIRTDLRVIRQDIGICLQHDCLFPDLTVREHVQFFARLKGLYDNVSIELAESQIDQSITDVALFEKRNSASKSLSGGMKRKLSVAIAFCGNSKVVLLDEPTSGMDPFSRRFTWNVIRQYRKERCIILTTHFMDEADILGDRIAIMADGQLRCAGSSLFLKKHYGVGYQLTIEKNQSFKGKASQKHSSVDGLDGNVANASDGGTDTSENLRRLVQSAVPQATVLNDVGTEIRYQLPLGASDKFSSMFDSLDAQVDSGNIVTYGVSMTTLDEVFLLVARGDTIEENKAHFASSLQSKGNSQHDNDADRSIRSRIDLDNERLFGRHVRSLFKKRAINFQRDKKAWCCTTILPVVFSTLGFMLFYFATPDRNLSSITLDLGMLNPEILSTPVNPISVNSPNNPFTCQPGNCAYIPIIEVAETGEIYTFCGSQANLEAPIEGSNSIPDKNLCSIAESFEILATLNDFNGAVAVEANVQNIGNSSQSLFDSSDNYQSSQYGAIWFTREPGSLIIDSSSPNATFADGVDLLCQQILLTGLTNYSSAEDCTRLREGYGYVVQYNHTCLHVAPLYQTLADQALVRYAVNNSDFKITTSISPLPITSLEEGLGESEDVFNAWFLVVLSFPFIAGAYASFVVVERESKAKHLQTVAGVEPTAYWLSTFLWDVVNYQIPMWLIVASMFIFQVDAMTTSKNDVFSGILAVLFLYGPASAGYSYCWSFAFTSPSVCNVFLIVTGFIVGFGGPLTIFILLILSANPNDPDDNLKTVAKILTWVLRFSPSFCLGKGIFFATNISFFTAIEGDPALSVWTEPVLLFEVIFLFTQGVGYIILAILLDIWSSRPHLMSRWNRTLHFLTCGCSSGHHNSEITTALPEDDDVVAEQDRVNSGDANSDLIVLSQLSKVFSNGKVAVNNLSLGIPHGECFGLVGINGAGKTTTMSMLTAEFPPSSGDATLAGFSITKEPQKIRRRIGYCPQFDAHFAQLSGRNHVELYASIKGVPLEFLKEAAAEKLKEVGLSEYDSDRLCVKYSGGMKRRLSLACATIGQPQIVFLDECSTGVDPVARREIWQLVSDMVLRGNVREEEKTSVILTTHSMEECEALCPRIGIMANGRLRCLGSAQHLKNKFGQGYQLEMKTKNVEREDEDYISNVSALASTLTGASDEDREEDLSSDIFFNKSQAVSALQSLTQDNFLSDMVSLDSPTGYGIWKDSTSLIGVSLDDLAAFATTELRMRKIALFLNDAFPLHVLRERQDSKARYEVGAQDTRISRIFEEIESHKSELQLSDYGVSQTSLEQVFNMHAAEAEKLKQGLDDR